MTATADTSLFTEMLEDFFGSVPYRFYRDAYECEEEKDESLIKFLHDTPGREFTLELDEDETVVTLSAKVGAILWEKFPQDFEVNTRDWLLLVERYEAAGKSVLTALRETFAKKAAMFEGL